MDDDNATSSVSDTQDVKFDPFTGKSPGDRLADLEKRMQDAENWLIDMASKVTGVEHLREKYAKQIALCEKRLGAQSFEIDTLKEEAQNVRKWADEMKSWTDEVSKIADMVKCNEEEQKKQLKGLAAKVAENMRNHFHIEPKGNHGKEETGR